jgi:hypothetical protein
VYRFVRTRSTWILLLFPAAVGALRIAGGHVATQFQEAERVAQGLQAAAAADQNAFGPLADGLRTGGAALALLLLVLGALAVVRERESGGLAQWVIAAPRTMFVLARAFGLAVWLLAGIAVLFLFCLATAGLLHDLGPVVEDGHEMATAAELWADTGRALMATVPALLCAALFGLFVSTISSTAGAAVAATLVPFVLFDVLRGLLGGAADHVFVTYVPFLGEDAPLARLTDIARAYSDAFWEDGELRAATLVPAWEALVLIVLSVIVVRARPAT